MTTRVPMPRVSARVSYLVDKLEDDIKCALHAGLYCVFKHGDDPAPSADLEARIVDELSSRVMGVLFDALDFHQEDAAPASTSTAASKRGKAATMTIDEWADSMTAYRVEARGFDEGARAAYRDGLIDGMLAFLARERTRHEDDIREISTDVAAIKSKYPWVRVVEPREHVEVG
jgi:hypothetical protein